MLRLLLLALLFAPGWMSAQVPDNFSDGNFLNPDWEGDTALFVQENGLLRSNGPAVTATLAISTALPAFAETEWRLTLDYAFAPSTTNFIRYYLSSDQPDLKNALNGYFVQAGETGNADSYDLFRQNGSTTTLLIDGVAGRAATTVQTTLRIRRDNQGNWRLESSDENGNWRLEGTATDNSLPATGQAGVYVRHSSTRNQSFFFDDFYAGPWELDLVPPELAQVVALSESVLAVTFSEPMDSASLVIPSSFVVDQGIGAASQVLWQNSQQVQAIFSQVFQSQQAYQLTVSNVEDLAGNLILPGSSRSFQFVAPPEYVFGMVRINEVMFDPTPANQLPEVEYVELLNRSPFVLNLSGWTLSHSSGSGTLASATLSPGGYSLLTAPSDTSLFSPVSATAVSPWPSLVNTGRTLLLTAPDGTLIDSFSYKPELFSVVLKRLGGFSLELINPGNLSCPPSANWDGALLPVQGSPGLPNTLLDTLHNSTPGEALFAEIVGPNLIRVCFSVPMNPVFLADPTRYELEGFGPVEEVEIEGSQARCVLLSFGATIPAGQVFQLRIDGQESCFGVPGPTQRLPVVKGLAAVAGQVLINEIYPDENPSRGLPEAEFLELFNTTDQYLDISGGGISDGGAIETWANAQIGPNGYLILCDRDDSLAFAAFGNVLTVDAMPSLNNSGDSLSLYGPGGELWDKVFYSSDWYLDAAKAEGGYSLEKINASLGGCNLPGNWRGSAASVGGTPGQLNSVAGSYADTEAPTLDLIGFLDRQTMVLAFSEEMGPSLEEAQQYRVEPDGLTPLAVSTNKGRTQAVLLFQDEFAENILYTIIASDLSDCSGNTATFTKAFGLPVPAQPGDVLLSEILPNPFTGGSDFVEIYNASDKILDLSEWNLGEIVPGTDSIFNADPLAEQTVIFLPGEYICLTADEHFQRATYLPPSGANFWEMSAFPSYDDAEGEVVLFTEGGIVLDRFAYQDEYHYPDLRDENGISLERLSFFVPTQQPDNWHSAASTVRFATPGYPNSQRTEQGQPGEALVWLEPAVITPDGDGNNDVLAIQYAFDLPGENARVTILDRAGRVVREVRRQELLGTAPGSFFWDGRSEAGQRVPVGPYVVLFETTNQNDGSRNLWKLVVVVGS